MLFKKFKVVGECQKIRNYAFAVHFSFYWALINGCQVMNHKICECLMCYINLNPGDEVVSAESSGESKV